ELNQAMNRGNWPHFEASALTGTGVFETLKGISKLTLLSLKRRLAKDQRPTPTVRPGPMPRPAVHPEPAHAPAGAAAGRPAQPHAAPVPVAAAAAPAPAPAPPAPAPVVPQTPPPPAAAPAPSRPAAAASITAAPRPAPPKAKTQSDVLAELEKIRRQALRPAVAPAVAPAPAAPAPPAAVSAMPPAVAAAATNGKHEINREIQLTLKRGDFERAKRFLLTLQVEDGQHQVMEAVRDFQVDIGAVPHHQKVVLRLNIALRTKE